MALESGCRGSVREPAEPRVTKGHTLLCTGSAREYPAVDQRAWMKEKSTCSGRSEKAAYS